MNATNYRWKIFYAVDEDLPTYELYDLDADVIVLDVKMMAGTLVVRFHDGASDRVINLATFEVLLLEVRQRLFADLQETRDANETS